MPKIASLQSSFNAGELSPLMYGRTDSPRYKQGLATCLNYIPTLQGPLVRRPGNMFMNTVKDSTKPPVLIPFQFSVTQAYILEFGDKYIRFYANNGQIITSGTTYKVTGLKTWWSSFYGSRGSATAEPNEDISTSSSVSNGSILEVQTPYSYTDLPFLRYVQNADTLYLFHPNYPTYKLQRFSQQYWDLTQVYFQDGPYLPLNSYAIEGDNLNVTLTPVSGSSALDQVQAGPILTISGVASASGLIQITTSTAHGLSTGQTVFITGVTGTTEANCYYPLAFNTTGPVAWTIFVVSPTVFSLLGSAFVNAYISGGTVAPAIFAADMTAIINSTTPPDGGRLIALDISGARYWGVFPINTLHSPPLSIFLNASLASVQVNAPFFPGTTTATAWQMGVYSYGLGFPSCGTFHQNRLCLAGSPNSPEEIDGSETGLNESFSASDPATLDVTDDKAISFNLNSTSVNKLQWMCSNAQGLLSGSYSAEWAMTPDSASAALTPTNFNAQQTSYYGSANAEAVQAGNAAIYIQRAQRKVREMNFFFQVGTFRSTDLTELSEHITLPSITKLVYAKETQPLVWGLRSDGNLISMIYDRSDVSLQAGWTRHQLGGQSDSAGTNPIVYSMAVIPDPTISFDQLWIVVQRYINGATVYTIEYMTKIFDDSMLQEDACQLDCGATFYNPKTITGITNASTAVVTSAAHGFSNGNQIKIVGVNGLNLKTTDINGNVTISNLVNEKTFVVAGVTTNTFQLNDFNGNPVSSTAYGAYVSGGATAKLVSTISGLTWLENETVGVLTDGSWHPDCVVSSGGSITLRYPAAKVQIGYRFNSQGQLLRIEGGAADGTSIGKTRRTTRVAVQAHRIGDLSIGTSFTNLIPVEFSQGDVQQADVAVPLYSGIKRDGVESAYDFESQVCFQQSSPLPGGILSITSFMEEFDV